MGTPHPPAFPARGPALHRRMSDRHAVRRVQKLPAATVGCVFQSRPPCQPCTGYAPTKTVKRWGETPSSRLSPRSLAPLSFQFHRKPRVISFGGQDSTRQRPGVRRPSTAFPSRTNIARPFKSSPCGRVLINGRPGAKRFMSFCLRLTLHRLEEAKGDPALIRFRCLCFAAPWHLGVEFPLPVSA